MAVEWLADYVTKVINFGYRGAAVIYGDPFMILHPFLMMVSSFIKYRDAFGILERLYIHTHIFFYLCYIFQVHSLTQLH